MQTPLRTTCKLCRWRLVRRVVRLEAAAIIAGAAACTRIFANGTIVLVLCSTRSGTVSRLFIRFSATLVILAVATAPACAAGLLLPLLRHVYSQNRHPLLQASLMLIVEATGFDSVV